MRVIRAYLQVLDGGKGRVLLVDLLAQLLLRQRNLGIKVASACTRERERERERDGATD